MSRLSRIELIQPYNYYFPSLPSVVLRETSIFAPKTLAFPSFIDEVEEYELGFGLDLLPSPIELFDSVTDLIRIDRTPSFSSYRRIQRVEKLLGGDIFVQSLSDRVNELESRFDRLAKIKGAGDRRYTWTAETKTAAKNGGDRKYKLTAEIKDGKKKKKKETEATGKTYKWTAEIETDGAEGPISRTYMFKASSGDAGDCGESKKKDKKKGEHATRVVEIEEPANPGAVVLRQV